ncbi:MAG: OAM dimerization domain-containing protein, partial [Mesotoga sp.]|uniref:OAM dimerization domain-containing protein n=1 Tax=Mesotoga sp. TaxID=2053577 RepID=UPI0035684CD2
MDEFSVNKEERVSKIDLSRITPYGDTMNDGKVQLSFTLPAPFGPEADEAAKLLIRKMGLKNPQIVFSKEM